MPLPMRTYFRAPAGLCIPAVQVAAGTDVLIFREFGVGFTNGVIFAILIGLVNAVRFADVQLGVVRAFVSLQTLVK